MRSDIISDVDERDDTVISEVLSETAKGQSISPRRIGEMNSRELWIKETQA